MKRLNDIYTEWYSGSGIFHDLSSIPGVVLPWASDVSSDTLDLDYHSRSGDKYISVTLDRLTDILTTATSRASIAKIIWNRYGEQWKRLYATLDIDYDPLVNYDRHEVHSGDDTLTKTPTGWKSVTQETPDDDYKVVETQKPTEWKTQEHETPDQNYKVTDVQKPTNWKETTEESASDDYSKTSMQKPTEWKTETTSLQADNGGSTTTSVKAFNSSDYVETNKATTDAKSKSTSEQSGTLTTEDTMTGSLTTTKEQAGTFTTEHTQTGGLSKDITQSGTYATEHTQTGGITTSSEQLGTMEDKTDYGHVIDVKGNIGVTTSQQMLQSEIDLWSKWNFWPQVYRDIDSILCLSIY